ncbi:MAG: DUF5131 family protein [Bacilli bacterium]|nr:DUF5131 family protein [Bacilli bacterium]
MVIWDPWRGCHKYSEGCENCYIHRADIKKGIDTNKIIKTDKFDLPVLKNKKGEYKIKPNNLVYLCFRSDFLIEEADSFRLECFKMIKERPDLHFIFLTKRIERFDSVIPSDWKDGYDNVTVGCTIENQRTASYRLEIFSKLKIKHKNIICQPLIEKVSISKYLKDIELVVVGGESGVNVRSLNYDWVLALREECLNNNVSFQFRQCGSRFIKDGKEYFIKTKDLCSQARKARIDF